jgi:hypothetical protein
MAALIRLALVAWVGFLVFAGVRAFLRSRGRLQRRPPELEMPYCLRCESNRNVVVNSGEAARDAHWFCTKCREGF